jgi:integrase/recombinase XerD
MPALMPRNPHRNAPEYADRVNLIKKIKIGKDWRFAPVVPEANGRLKDKVRVNGEVEVHSEGSYYIEWWVSGRRFREATTREDAVECARHKSVELRAIRAGLIASPEPSPVAEAKTPIGDAIDDYLKYVKMQRKSRTFLTPRRSPEGFLQAKVRGGCHAARCYRLHDVLLRTGVGSAYRL